MQFQPLKSPGYSSLTDATGVYWRADENADCPPGRRFWVQHLGDPRPPVGHPLRGVVGFYAASLDEAARKIEGGL